MKLLESEHLQMLEASEIIKKKWLQEMFSKFSAIRSEYDHNEPSMNLTGLRQFIRLSGLKPFVPSSECDLIYTKLTKIYNSSDFSVTQAKITFKVFYETLFPEIAKIVYPKMSIEESLKKTFSEYIYPYLVCNLPFLRTFHPRESSDGVDEENKHKKHESMNLEIPLKNSIINATNIQDENTCRTSTPKFKNLRNCWKIFSVVSLRICNYIKKCFVKCIGMCTGCLNFTENTASKKEVISHDATAELLERRPSPP